MAILQGTYGPLPATADGAVSAGIRLDHTGALVHTAGRAPMAEQASRGLLYAGFIPPGTGQDHGSSIGTTGAFVLANPSGSGVNLVVYQIQVGYISGTLGAGVLALLAHFAAPPIVAPSGGTAITPTPLLLPTLTTAAANCRFNATVPATGIMIRAVANLSAQLATTAGMAWSVTDMVAGAVVVGPGSAVSLQGICGAAGTSPKITAGMIWAEEVAP